MNLKQATKTFLGVAAIPFIVGLASNAQATTLNDLLTPGATFVSGDKLFSNFTATCFTSGSANCDPNLIGVTALVANADGPGIQFSGLINALVGGFADLSLGFTVSVTDPHFLIHSVHLLGVGVAGDDGGVASVSETVDSGPGYSMGISIPMTTTDAVFLATDVTSLSVFKDILIVGGTNHFSDLSIIQQRFDQTSIPEPGILSLLGIGLVGWAASRRKPAQQAA